MKKRVLSWMLALCLVVGLLPTVALAEGEGTSTGWDGSADTSWYNNSATAFTITTAEQFAGLAAIVNGTAEGIDADTFAGKTITLGANIDLSGAVFTPIGTSSAAFNGTFDGGDHTIKYEIKSEWYSTYSTATFASLFGYVTNTTIKNLNVDVSVSWTDTTNKCKASGLAGYATGTTFENITVSGTAQWNSDYTFAGMVMIDQGASTYKNCVNNLNVNVEPIYKNVWSNYLIIGGIVGQMNAANGMVTRLEECVNNGNFTVSCPFNVPEAYASDTCYSFRLISGGIIGQMSNAGNTYKVIITSDCKQNGTITGCGNECFVNGVSTASSYGYKGLFVGNRWTGATETTPYGTDAAADDVVADMKDDIFRHKVYIVDGIPGDVSGYTSKGVGSFYMTENGSEEGGKNPISFVESDGTARSATNEEILQLRDVCKLVGTFAINENVGAVVIYSKVKTKVDMPSADATAFSYTGAEQTYTLAENEYYTITGNKQTEVGTYTVTVALKDTTTTCWNNEAQSTDDLTYEFKIGKASPAMTVTATPAALTGGGTVTVAASAHPEDVVPAIICYPAITANADGTYTLPNSTETYTFTASYAESDHYQAAAVTCTVAVSAYYYYEPATTPSASTSTETTTNSDGSTTTTVTNTATGTVTETTEHTDGTTVTVETQTDGTVTTVEERADDVVVTTVTTPAAVTAASVSIPADVEVAVVEIPAPAVTSTTVAVNTVTGEIVTLSVLTEDGLAVVLEESADLILVDNAKDFVDTGDSWAQDEIDFVTSRELFNGTDTEAMTFSPDGAMDRAMVMTVLARLDGVDTSVGDTWYEAGMDWAVANGISDGTGIDRPVSREELVTMLYRYAGSPAVSESALGALGRFSDAHDLSFWSDAAMAWAVENGIINGIGGTLLPELGADRATVSAILMRFCEYIVG